MDADCTGKPKCLPSFPNGKLGKSYEWEFWFLKRENCTGKPMCLPFFHMANCTGKPMCLPFFIYEYLDCHQEGRHTGAPTGNPPPKPNLHMKLPKGFWSPGIAALLSTCTFAWLVLPKGRWPNFYSWLYFNQIVWSKYNQINETPLSWSLPRVLGAE